MISFTVILSTVAAACAITWESLASSVMRDPAWTSMENRRSSFDSTGRYLWQDLEARWKADDAEGEKHELSVRLSPAPLGSYRASRDLLRAQARTLAGRRTALEQDLKAQRLITGSQYLHRVWKLSIVDSLAQVASDRIRIQLQRQGTPRFDPQDLVLTQQNLAELEAERVGLAMQVRSSAQHLRILAGCVDSAEIRLEASNLRDASDLLRIIGDQRTPIAPETPREKLATSKLDAAQARLRFEEASSNQILSYVEAGATLRPRADGFKYLTEKDWMVGAGIRLPFGDGRSQDAMHRRMEVMSAASDRMELVQETREALRQQEEEIQALAIEHATLDAHRKKLREGTLWQDFARLAGGDPLLLLRAQEQELRSAEKMNGILLELRTVVVKRFALSGTLAETNPLIRERTTP